MPKSWDEAIIIPIYIKGDKAMYENYRGISLLNSAYKVFAKILLKRLTPYAVKNRKTSVWIPKREINSRTARYHRPTSRKKYEFRQNIWQLFVDFKKAYAYIDKASII